MSERLPSPNQRLLANMFTVARPTGAIILAREIIQKGPNFRSWKMAGKIALVLGTDKADGFFARRSQIPSQFWSMMDHRLDATTYALFMYSYAVATEDPFYIEVAVVNSLRNIATEAARRPLRERGLSAGARPLGQAKTTLQDLAVITDASPLGDAYPRATRDLHLASAGLSLVAGADIVLHSKRQLDNFRQSLHDNGVTVPNT